MKIIVSHVYSNDNKGDAALLSVLLTDIRRAFENPDITILTLSKIKNDEMFEGVPVKNTFMHHVSDRYSNPLIRILYAVFVVVSTLLWATVYRLTRISLPLPKHLKDIVNAYREADLIIPVGGGYVVSKSGLMNTVKLFFVIHPFLFSYILGKPTVNYTQSVGPFGSRFQEFMAKFAINRLNGIIVRENISLSLLKKWGITKNVLLSVDSGFSFTSSSKKNIRTELGIPKEQMMVGITVRNWFKGDQQIKYEKTIAQLCDYIVENYKAAVVFIPQVTVDYWLDDDRETGSMVHSYMRNKKDVYLVNDRYDHSTIKAIYGQLDYLVGVRFHSVIFALTSHVPAIAVEYEYKTSGIMIDLGLGDWVINIKNIEFGKLVELFDRLVAGKDSYRSHLSKVLPAYIAKSDTSIYFVKKLYEDSESV